GTVGHDQHVYHVRWVSTVRQLDYVLASLKHCRGDRLSRVAIESEGFGATPRQQADTGGQLLVRRNTDLDRPALLGSEETHPAGRLDRQYGAATRALVF